MATQIGVQMYTLRDHCQTPVDIAKTCKKLKDMGFGAIQASAAGFNTIDGQELRKILDDTGLICAATHQSLDQLRDPGKCLDFHAALDCELTAIGGFHGETEAQWRDFVKDYNALSAQFAGKPLRIGYHNHSHEFAPFGTPAMGVLTPYQLLADELEDDVWFELDTYWVTHGGGNPAAWITKIANSGSNRLPAIHVKDMTITREREHKMCEVGSGNLDWPSILDAAKAAGVQWYLIERDTGDLDPFESLKISLDNMKAMGLS